MSSPNSDEYIVVTIISMLSQVECGNFKNQLLTFPVHVKLSYRIVSYRTERRAVKTLIVVADLSVTFSDGIFQCQSV